MFEDFDMLSALIGAVIVAVFMCILILVARRRRKKEKLDRPSRRFKIKYNETPLEEPIDMIKLEDRIVERVTKRVLSELEKKIAEEKKKIPPVPTFEKTEEPKIPTEVEI